MFKKVNILRNKRERLMIQIRKHRVNESIQIKVQHGDDSFFNTEGGKIMVKSCDAGFRVHVINITKSDVRNIQEKTEF